MKRLLSSILLITFSIAIGYTQGVNKAAKTGRIWVENTGVDAIDVWCERYEISLVDSSVNYFCWDACYPPFVGISNATLSIGPGDTNKVFYTSYTPGVPGTSIIKYCFYINGMPGDSACLTMGFNDNSPSDTVYGIIAINPTVVMTGTTVSTDASVDTCDGTSTVTAANGLGTYTYQWDSNAGGQNTQMATGLCAGVYNVSVTDSAGNQVIVVATVGQAVGINANTKLYTPKFSVYPNPAINRIVVNYSLEQKSEYGELIVRNILGSQMYKVAFKGASGQVIIPVEKLDNGIYFCTMTVDNEVFQTRRFVVKH